MDTDTSSPAMTRGEFAQLRSTLEPAERGAAVSSQAIREVVASVLTGSRLASDD